MKEIQFKTRMSADVLFEYLLRHTYTSPMGIIGVLAGVFLIIAFISGRGSIVYLMGGIVVLMYLPVSLYMSAKRQAMNPALKYDYLYTLNDEGMRVERQIPEGENTEDTDPTNSMSISWNMTTKARFTKNLIIVYTSKVNAWIFPRKDLGELAGAAEKLIREKVK